MTRFLAWILGTGVAISKSLTANSDPARRRFGPKRARGRSGGYHLHAAAGYDGPAPTPSSKNLKRKLGRSKCRPSTVSERLNPQNSWPHKGISLDQAKQRFGRAILPRQWMHTPGPKLDWDRPPRISLLSGQQLPDSSTKNVLIGDEPLAWGAFTAISVTERDLLQSCWLGVRWRTTLASRQTPRRQHNDSKRYRQDYILKSQGLIQFFQFSQNLAKFKIGFAVIVPLGPFDQDDRLPGISDTAAAPNELRRRFNSFRTLPIWLVPRSRGNFSKISRSVFHS